MKLFGVSRSRVLFAVISEHQEHVRRHVKNSASYLGGKMRYRSRIFGPGNKCAGENELWRSPSGASAAYRVLRYLIYSLVIRLYLGQIAMKLHGFTVRFVNN